MVLRGCLRLLLAVAAVASPASAASATGAAGVIDPRFFIAGGTCAAISHGITTPIDVVKTRMQSNPDKYKSLLPATATIIKEEGAQALTKGLVPTLVGYGIEGALKFGIYEVSKPLAVLAFQRLNNKLNRSGKAGALPFLLASIMAGAVASLVLVPMESTRIRMVTDASFEGIGLLRGLGKLIDEAGLVQTLTVGLGAMLAKQVPYTFGKQVSFDVVAKFLYGILNNPSQSTASLAETISKSFSPEFIKWTVSVLSAMIASVMACLMSQPGDVILTETYKGGDGDATKKRGLAEVSSTIFARNSDDGVVLALTGFFTGLQARFVHVGMIITSQLVIYDLVKQLLGLPATGSH
ncbi:hypothetical protein ACHAWT_004878 [Skeletonema menzelii]|mmetsp:Transcript_23636/g.39018  ORF Transcript_23636/g.39018 Transcript_23636/m.39018 type:complete len:352 (+) Transcript_23636:25-1080(+)